MVLHDAGMATQVIGVSGNQPEAGCEHDFLLVDGTSTRSKHRQSAWWVLFSICGWPMGYTNFVHIKFKLNSHSKFSLF
jgi:hypothetical protein